MWRFLVVMGVGGIVGSLTACAGEISGGAPSDAPDAGDDIALPVSLAFLTPTAAAREVRDELSADGALIAAVEIHVAIEGAPAHVDIVAGGVTRGAVDRDGRYTVELDADGPVTLEAIAYDADEVQLATATVDIEVVAPPIDDDCHAALDVYGLTYQLGPAQPGVSDPVTVTTPINGLAYRYVSSAEPRTELFMDCTLARSLAEAAPILRARGVVEVADIGVYNYRCIGSEGTPPDCVRGMSQHAYARGIDLAGFTDDAGTFYSVNDDWVIDPDGERTCTATTEPGKDAFLHEVICALKAADVWTIVLTPNYNDAHRDHFHVDLTAGSDYINFAPPDAGDGDDDHAHDDAVDVGPDRH